MRCAAAGGAALLAVLVAGCGGMTSFTGDNIWITPGKYHFYDCKQLIGIEQRHRQRLKVLEELMAKAAGSPGGAVIGTLAYRTEYQQTVGEHKLAAATIEEKRCVEDRSSTSAQSVF